MTQFFTIGHSNRSAEDFIALLNQHGITHLADVRRMPRSNFNPQFNDGALKTALIAEDMGHTHLPELGGMRRARGDSPNKGLREGGGLQGYADYMATDDFERALGRLIALAEGERLAFMCAERDPNDCHRQLIADMLVSRGHKVTHIVTTEETREHALKDWVRVEHGRLTYPAKRGDQLAML